MRLRLWLFISLAALCTPVTRAQDAPPAGDPAAQVETRLESNIPYRTGEGLSDYEKEWCQLDLYLPPSGKGFPTLVWLYGGGLTSGTKDGKGMPRLAQTFVKEGIGFAAINYRLHPKVSFPAYVDDAATAFAWVHKHIAARGGDPQKVFLGGHSAGGYLTSLVGMDVRYLEKAGLKQDDIAGLIPVSGQMLTHFHVRKERGLEGNAITADEAAPIFFTRKDTRPILILMGDKDWPARWEENVYFAAAMKAAGNGRVSTLQVPDRDHGSIVGRIPQPGDPAARAILDFITRISAERGGPK